MINALLLAAAILIVGVILFAPEYGHDALPRQVDGSQCMLDVLNSNLARKPMTKQDFEASAAICRAYYKINPDAK